MVEAVESIPVVANGDIRTLADAAATFAETGCAAVSIGRGALSNPFLFRQLAHWAEHGDPGPEPTFDERLDLMSAHFHGLLDRRGERLACLQFRKIIKWYSYAIRPPTRALPPPDQPLERPALRRHRRRDPLLRARRSPLPGHFEPRVPVPSGPIDKW